MKSILIAGSRSITDFDLSPYVPGDVGLIITGGANGIDRLAENYADQHKISKMVLYPEYNLYGRAAPIIRNEKMVDVADFVLVIWDGKSKGSESTIRYAKKKQKSISIIQV